MAKLEIQTGTENEILRMKSKKVVDFGMKTARLELGLGELVKGMKGILDDQKGLGLAAPQVGENVRVILVRMNSGSDHETIFVMINPEIVERSWGGEGSGDGLSLQTRTGSGLQLILGKVKKGGGAGASATAGQAGGALKIGSSEIENVGKKLETDENGAEFVLPEGAEVAEEGCLSLPGYYVNVVRAKDIVVNFVDGRGLLKKGKGLGGAGGVVGSRGGAGKKLSSMTLNLSGLNARIVQHEVDHLDGMLICDRVME